MEVKQLLQLMELAHANALTVYNLEVSRGSSKKLLEVLNADIADFLDAVNELRKIKEATNG